MDREWKSVFITCGSRRRGNYTMKHIGSKVLDGLTGAMTPILPAYIVAGIYSMIVTLFGPGYLNMIAGETPVQKLLTIVCDACYYFAPMFTAWSASGKFRCSTILAMILAGIMIHPSMLEIVSAGESFVVFGIPMRLVNYTQAVLPIVMTTWALSIAERFFLAVVPDRIRVVAVPVLTILVMLPAALCLLGPACYYVMSLLADLIIWLSETAGILAMTLLGATWVFVVMFGMHIPILSIVLPVAMSIGYDPVVFPASIATSFASLGTVLGYALMVKEKEEKVLAWEYFVTMLTANTGKPFLYGVMMRNKKVLVYSILSGAIGGLLMGLLKCKVYTFSGVGFIFLNPIRFGEDVVKAAIVGIICVLIPVLLSMAFGVEEKNAC